MEDLRKYYSVSGGAFGGGAKKVVKANETLRIALYDGFSTVSVVAWNAEDPTERMNLPDTVKVQWTTGLGKGRVIFSDMGKVMFSITEDSSGAHDVLMGGSTASSNAA